MRSRDKPGRSPFTGQAVSGIEVARACSAASAWNVGRRVPLQVPAGCWLRRLFFFFNDTATTEIYTLSLHDALPISIAPTMTMPWIELAPLISGVCRSEEHTSELQSPVHLVCRLLLEKKKKKCLLTDVKKQIVKQTYNTLDPHPR